MSAHQVAGPQDRHFWRLKLSEPRSGVVKQPDGSVQGSGNSELEPGERQLGQDRRASSARQRNHRLWPAGAQR